MTYREPTTLDTTEIMMQLRSASDDLIDAEFTSAEAKRRRDDLIVECRKAGLPLRQIADAALVSHQTVANVCNASDVPGAKVS